VCPEVGDLLFFAADVEPKAWFGLAAAGRVHARNLEQVGNVLLIVDLVEKRFLVGIDIHADHENVALSLWHARSPCPHPMPPLLADREAARDPIAARPRRHAREPSDRPGGSGTRTTSARLSSPPPAYRFGPKAACKRQGGPVGGPVRWPVPKRVSGVAPAHRIGEKVFRGE